MSYNHIPLSPTSTSTSTSPVGSFENIIPEALLTAIKTGDAVTASKYLSTSTAGRTPHAILTWRDHGGNTALMYSALSSKPDLMRLLIKMTTDPNLQNNYGWTALSLACYNNNTSQIDILLGHPAIKLDLSTIFGFTPLMCSIYHGDIQTVRKMLDAGARVDTDKDVDGKTTASMGLTPLMLAAHLGKETIVAELLRRGAEYNAQCRLNGYTALMYAAANLKVAALRVLLENDADINVKNWDGKNALEIAMEVGYYEGVRLLREKLRDKLRDRKYSEDQSKEQDKILLDMFPDVQADIKEDAENHSGWFSKFQAKIAGRKNKSDEQSLSKSRTVEAATPTDPLSRSRKSTDTSNTPFTSAPPPSITKKTYSRDVIDNLIPTAIITNTNMSGIDLSQHPRPGEVKRSQTLNELQVSIHLNKNKSGESIDSPKSASSDLSEHGDALRRHNREESGGSAGGSIFESILKSIDLERYIPLFEKDGKVTVECCLSITDAELIRRGVSHSAHRRQILQAIALYKSENPGRMARKLSLSAKSPSFEPKSSPTSIKPAFERKQSASSIGSGHNGFTPTSLPSIDDKRQWIADAKQKRRSTISRNDFEM